MWPFRKPARVPTVPDDREELSKALQRAEQHIAAAQELRAEALPVAREAAFHVERNHFAQKVQKAYQLREQS